MSRAAKLGDCRALPRYRKSWGSRRDPQRKPRKLESERVRVDEEAPRVRWAVLRMLPWV